MRPIPSTPPLSAKVCTVQAKKLRASAGILRSDGQRGESPSIIQKWLALRDALGFTAADMPSQLAGALASIVFLTAFLFGVAVLA